MQTYIRTKTIKAKPMNRLAYVIYRGWTLPEDENGNDAGYLIEDTVVSIPNHPKHEGYITWMPSESFDLVFEIVPNLNFGEAITALKDGQKITRAGWNGKDMFVYLVPAASYAAQTGAAKSHFGEEAFIPYNAYMALKGVDNTVSTWVPSVTDVLAEDWSIV